MNEPDEPRLLILEPRRPGRPRAAPTSVVSARVPTSRHDQLARLARRHECSVSTLIERAVILVYKNP